MVADLGEPPVDRGRAHARTRSISSPVSHSARSNSWTPQSTARPPLTAGSQNAAGGGSASHCDSRTSSGRPMRSATIASRAFTHGGENRRQKPICNTRSASFASRPSRMLSSGSSDNGFSHKTWRPAAERAADQVGMARRRRCDQARLDISIGEHRIDRCVHRGVADHIGHRRRATLAMRRRPPRSTRRRRPPATGHGTHPSGRHR